MRHLPFSVEKCGDRFKIVVNNTTLELSKKGFKESLDRILNTVLPLEPGDRVDLVFMSDLQDQIVPLTVPNRAIPDIIRMMQTLSH